MTKCPGKGHIWPEYWIDCCKCDDRQPLATSKSPAVAAKKQGWKRHGDSMNGPWICRSCQSIEQEAAQSAE